MITKTEKPWGYEEILTQNDKYVIKRLVVREGHRLSLQKHKEKRETWLIQSGRGAITIGDDFHNCFYGKIFDIPPNTIHRVFAGKGNIEILEVSTPELWDVERIEDDYGRNTYEYSQKPTQKEGV